MIEVSIIIPVYNAADVIGETINSVLRQDYTNWEIIIVDDGSSDAILEVVTEFTQRDDRIKFFRQPNAGASAARNAGIRVSQYDWLLFLDADDWIREDYFEKMIPVLESDASVDVVHCGWTRVQKDGSLSKPVYGGEQLNMFPSLAHYSPFAIHCCIVRKKLIEDVGGFDVSFKTCVDWDLWQRVARTGARFIGVKETMAFYRTRSESLSSNVNQFCLNGLQVISNAYTADHRVLNPDPQYKNGLPDDDVNVRKCYFVTWCAGVLLGQGKNATQLLEHLKDAGVAKPDGSLIGEILIDSLIIPAEKETSDWYNHFKFIKDNLTDFLLALEKQTSAHGIFDQAHAVIERHVLSQTKHPISKEIIGKTFASKIDVESPIQDADLPAETERFVGLVKLKDEMLGLVELAATDHFVSAAMIKDEIATKFSWQILYQFFCTHVYPAYSRRTGVQITKEMHDKMGWEFFLRELWNKPDWSESKFYDANAAKKEKGPEITADEEIHIEIAKELPVVKSKLQVLKIYYYIGGAKAGTTLCKLSGKLVYPQMIRAAINVSSGYEICRLVVREALIGHKLDDGLSLYEKLATTGK